MSGTSEHYNTTGERHGKGPTASSSSPRAQQSNDRDQHDAEARRSSGAPTECELLALDHLVRVFVVRLRLLGGRGVWRGRCCGRRGRGGEHGGRGGPCWPGDCCWRPGCGFLGRGPDLDRKSAC